jgi:hypothetical protein
MITDEFLHDVLQDHLHTKVGDAVDSVLARVAFNRGELPSNERIAAVVKNVLSALAGLPGEHWLPDDLREPT